MSQEPIPLSPYLIRQHRLFRRNHARLLPFGLPCGNEGAKFDLVYCIPHCLPLLYISQAPSPSKFIDRCSRYLLERKLCPEPNPHLVSHGSKFLSAALTSSLCHCHSGLLVSGVKAKSCQSIQEMGIQECIFLLCTLQCPFRCTPAMCMFDPVEPIALESLAWRKTKVYQLSADSCDSQFLFANLPRDANSCSCPTKSITRPRKTSGGVIILSR